MSSLPGSASVAVTFALPDESRAFSRRLAHRQVIPSPDGHLPLVVGECGGQRVTLIHTGVGDSAGCRQRLEFALAGAGGATDKPAQLISSGYAGALQPGAAVGDLILADNLSAPALADEALRLLTGCRCHRAALTSQPKLAETPREKAALAAATGAWAVDMESGWIAQACARAGVPMLALRVISDAADQGFPAPGYVLFDLARQRPRYFALPLWLLRHPGRIAPFVRFVRGLGPAQETLAGALERLLAGRLSAMNVALP